MKLIPLAILLLLVGCATQTSESSSSADSTAVSQPLELTQDQKIQLALDSILLDMDEKMKLILRDDPNPIGYGLVRYNEHFEYEGTQLTYVYVDYALSCRYSNMGAEGGYEETKFSEYRNDNQEYWGVFIKNEGGNISAVFAYLIKGKILFYNFKYEINEDHRKGLLLQGDADSSWFPISESGPHLKNINDNQQKFKFVDRKFEYYLERDSVNSEYGRQLVYKVYQIDSSLFLNLFSKN